MLPCPGERQNVRLDATLAQARSLARSFALDDGLDGWIEQRQEFLSSRDDDLSEARKAVAKVQQDSWAQWQEKALSG
eukprot:4043458-Pyramimonas_sp.AAC.1